MPYNVKIVCWLYLIHADIDLFSLLAGYRAHTIYFISLLISKNVLNSFSCICTYFDFKAVRTPPSTIKENKKQWDRDIPTSPTSQTPNSRRSVSDSSNENMNFQIPESPVAKSSAPLPPSRKESFAEVERQRKLLSQLPPQDFDPKFCSTLNRKQKVAMNKMSSIKKEAAGKGKLTGNEKQQVTNFYV